MKLDFAMEKEILTDYLQQKKLIDPDDRVVSLEKPGEGNMNFVVRVRSNRTSLILKQANEFVQKFPHIPAPTERAAVEASFYKTVKEVRALADKTPKILFEDAEDHILAIEDLGLVEDCTYLYRKGESLSDGEVDQLTFFLSELHHLPSDKIRDFPVNMALRQLNHEHIFVYPFMEQNGLNLNDIQSGLQQVARPYQTSNALREKVDRLGEIYLLPGRSLLHGDYYPGSWVKGDKGLTIIDPEFSHAGYPEFEVGILIAHLRMAECQSEQINRMISGYAADDNFNWSLCHKFAAVEVMRRLIGLAQLPLEMSLEAKERLLHESSVVLDANI